MDDRDGGVPIFVLLHEKQSERFAYNHAAAKNHHVRTVDFGFGFSEQTLHTERGARHKAGRIIEYELCNVFRVKSVHVLTRVERAHDCRLVDVLRRWRLNQDAVNAGLVIEFFGTTEKLRLWGGCS